MLIVGFWALWWLHPTPGLCWRGNSSTLYRCSSGPLRLSCNGNGKNVPTTWVFQQGKSPWATHELRPEYSLCWGSSASTNGNEHFLMERILLRNSSSAIITISSFSFLKEKKKKAQIFIFFNVGKNSYLYGHFHQFICIWGYVKASFIFYLKSSSASTDWILPRQRFWSHRICLITLQCCAYLLPAHALLLTGLCLYNNYILLPQAFAKNSCQSSLPSVNRFLLQIAKKFPSQD